jgi:hypothetical protein
LITQITLTTLITLINQISLTSGATCEYST